MATLLEPSKQSEMWGFYNSVLHRHPLKTEMATSAALWFGGDVLAQYLEQRFGTKKTIAPTKSIDSPKQHRMKQQKQIDIHKSSDAIKYDWHRAGIQTVYAGIIWAPFGHYWYEWLDRAAHSLAPANTGKMRFVGTKVFLETVLLHPMALFAFFTCVGLMGGDSIRDIMQQLRKDYFPSLMLEISMWTPIDIANFLYVPVKHQLLLVNTVCLFESVMLSYIKANGLSLPGHGEEKTQKKKKE